MKKNSELVSQLFTSVSKPFQSDVSMFMQIDGKLFLFQSVNDKVQINKEQLFINKEQKITVKFNK